MSSASSSEEWRPVYEWEGLYEVSNLGNIRSVDRWVTWKNGTQRFCHGAPMSQKSHARGYGHKQVSLSNQDRKATPCVHTLVLEAFVGPCPDGMEACHRNYIASDNRVENLYWGTRSRNRRDRMVSEHGSEDHCPNGHFYHEKNRVKAKAKNGWRACLSCDRAGAAIGDYPEWAPLFQEVSDIQYENIINGPGRFYSGQLRDKVEALMREINFQPICH